MEAHLRVLLDWDARVTSGNADVDDVYVWWGKVRSNQRQQPMPHLDAIVALGAEAADDPDELRETHLYLTDYRMLYVANVTAITAEDPRACDAHHVPEYYTSSDLTCDCWFEISDIRLLVRDDLDGVAAELARLRNTRYHDRPVSLYGGMLELPLLVSRPDGRHFFDPREQRQLADDKLWARFDAEQGGLGALEVALREDHLGEIAWSALDATARRFIAMAERTFRDHRRDPAADLAPVVVGYAKALEIQLNGLIRTAMHGAAPAATRVKLGASTQLLPGALPLTLGQIAFALGGEPAFADHIQKVLTDGNWLRGEFAVILDAFVEEARNPASHGASLPREVVVRWRNRLLGVGHESLVTRLAKVQRRS
ncbi:MAG TPA: hypothetical protein VE869_15420 [Gemmatimonas sp.]|nr:hypothetical protein [Gemmatimonas sp.]